MGKPKKQREAPRIRRIELSEKNKKMRWIFAGVLLLIGLVCIAIGVNSCVSTETGWQTVESTSAARNCADDFVLIYDFGRSGQDAKVEKRNLLLLYDEAVEKAWRLFNTHVGEEVAGSLSELNAHPNEKVKLDSVLYSALEKLDASGTRYGYLAAVYDEYSFVLEAEMDGIAGEWDPERNPEVYPYIQQAAAFANDPNAVDLQLLADGYAMLTVSDDYAQFLETYEIDVILDLGWLKNAFIVDYMASTLSQNGFNSGYLVSYDGFTRNLDTSGENFSFNIFDRQQNDIYIPAIWRYSDPVSIVFLRDYPMSDKDVGRFYLYSDGQTVTDLIDPADGRSKSATDNLVGYSKELSCADIALKLAPLFIADSLEPDAVTALSEDGLYCIWFDGGILCYTEKDAEIAMQTTEDAAYKAEYAGK